MPLIISAGIGCGLWLALHEPLQPRQGSLHEALGGPSRLRAVDGPAASIARFLGLRQRAVEHGDRPSERQERWGWGRSGAAGGGASSSRRPALVAEPALGVLSLDGAAPSLWSKPVEALKRNGAAPQHRAADLASRQGPAGVQAACGMPRPELASLPVYAAYAANSRLPSPTPPASFSASTQWRRGKRRPRCLLASSTQTAPGGCPLRRCSCCGRCRRSPAAALMPVACPLLPPAITTLAAATDRAAAHHGRAVKLRLPSPPLPLPHPADTACGGSPPSSSQRSLLSCSHTTLHLRPPACSE